MEGKKGPSENSFTIIWKIENSHYFFEAGYKLHSPVVSVDVMEQTGWRLELSRLQPRNFIYVTIKRDAVDNGPEKFDLLYDFDIEPIVKQSLRNVNCSHAFRRDETGPPVLLCKVKPKIKSEFIIRCVLKRNDGIISVSGQCIVRTLISGEDIDFVAKVENFSSLNLGEKRTLKVLSTSKDEKLMTVDLRLLNEHTYLALDIIPTTEKSEYRYKLLSTILDCSDNEAYIRKCCEYTLRKTEQLVLVYSKKTINDFTDYYFHNDTLSLLFKITIHTGIEFEEIEYGTVSVECSDQKACSSSDLETSINPFSNALEDITSIYRKGILCDTKLQTATETFPAHKVILSARSPVFEAMFTSDMKEKIKECVRIDDIDSETVKRMLVFLYSDFLEELKWEDAKKLYFAADKYQILTLRHKCSVILKKNIDLSNCCELLLMADLHQDGDLKAAVQNYIERYDKQVFLSAQWRDMEKSHPLLAIDIFRAVHIKDS